MQYRRLARVLSVGLAALCCLGALGLAAPECARAQAGSVIVAGADPLCARIGAELEALGFQVVRFGVHTPASLGGDDSPGQLDEALDRAARQAQALAVVYVPAALEGRVEVWRIEARTGAAPALELVQAESGSASDSARVVAARVVELLRASQLVLQLPARPAEALPARDEASPPAEVPRSVASIPSDALTPSDAPAPRITREPPRSGGLLLELGVGVGASAGQSRLGPAPLLSAGIFWQSAPTLAFGLQSAISPGRSAAVGRRRQRSRPELGTIGRPQVLPVWGQCCPAALRGRRPRRLVVSRRRDPGRLHPPPQLGTNDRRRPARGARGALACPRQARALHQPRQHLRLRPTRGGVCGARCGDAGASVRVLGAERRI